MRDDEVFLIRCREHYVGIDPKLETRVRRWEARHEEKTRVRRAIAGRLRAERRRPPPGEVRIEEDERGFRVGWKRPHEQTRWAGRSPDLHGACVIVGYADVRSREEVVQLERELASRPWPSSQGRDIARAVVHAAPTEGDVADGRSTPGWRATEGSSASSGHSRGTPDAKHNEGTIR